MFLAGSNYSETLNMGKDERIEDVEEGEISDSASVEEISKDDFNKKEREVVLVKENTAQNKNTRVWTMTDLYNYQIKGGYVSGLYNLAWAQAVQNKPRNEILVEAAKEVIDVEEGELEEGEIDLDSTNVVVDDDGEGDVLEKKVNGILEELESFGGFGEVEKSFGDCCAKLECAVGRVQDVVGKCSGDKKDRVVELLLCAIRNVNLVFGLMNEDLKEQNKQVFSRLLSIVNTNDPPFLNKDQIKEIEAVITSLESSKVSSSARDGEKQNETEFYDGVSNKNDTLARSASSESAMVNVLSPGADYFSHNKPNTSLEVPKPGTNFKSRVGLLPLLDLHKDHDADSLPSPTRETAPQLPVHKAMIVGDGITKPGISVPKLVPDVEAPKMHPYETDALKAVSSYQQKFGSNSFFMANGLPSPTPSEESGDNGEGDTGGEVSSSLNLSNVSTINPPNLGQQVIAPPHIESSNLLSVITAGTTAPPSTVYVPAVKSTAKSRDPRLRFLNSDANTLDQNQRALPSVNNMPKVNPVGPILGSRKQKIVEDPIVEGPFKRQKNAFGNPGIVRDVKNTTGSGGWLEDSDVVGPQLINRNKSELDPRRLVNGLNYPSTTCRNERAPITGTSTSTGVELAPVAGNSLQSLPDLLKDIAVNPTMLITLLKMGQQHKLAPEAQQKLADPPKTMISVSMSNSVLASQSSSILSRPSGMLHSPLPTATKVQQKLADLPKTTTNVSMSNSILGTVLAVNNTSQSSSMISRPPGMLHTPLQTATKAQQKLADPPKTMTDVSISNSILGAVPAVSNTSQSSIILSRPPTMLHAPTQTATTTSQDESGKIRMKPRDPRRVLHNNSLQRAGSISSELLKSNAVPTLTTKGANDNQNVLQQEQAEMKTVPSQSTAPDISLQLTKSLMNIADIISVSHASTTSSVGCQITASQPVQNKSDKVDAKPPILSSDHQAATVSISEGGTRSQNTWGDVEHLFEGYDDHQKAAIQKERARRMDEQKKMFAARKLCLVLDLDHTLLNSAKFVEVDPMHDEILRKKEEQDREKPYRHLFRFPHMGMWTKLRPGIWNFLEKASKLYELHLYTMGNKLYATEMAKVLDPKGDLFNGRVISRGDDGEYFDGDERFPKNKDLEGVLGMESGVVIIDDSVRVWPHNKLNLIVVERYIYFPCSRRQFGLPGPSLLEIDHDERPEDGTLASSLAVIEKIHQNFFNHQSLDEADVRNILASEQRKILAGCRIVFSRVFPVGEANPHLHPLWQTAEQFGAVCTNQIDERVTHVVANSLGTDKVNWALSNGKFVVYPGWVEASALLYRRANEQDFAIKS